MGKSKNNRQLNRLPDRTTAPATVQRSYLGFGAASGGFLSSIRTASSGVEVNEITALNLTAIWRAVNILAGDIMKLPLDVFKHLGNGKGKKPCYDHPVFRLLCFPNKRQAGRKLRFAAAVHLVLFQNAYLEILRDKETGEPLSLHLLDPRILVSTFHEGREVYKFSTGVSPYSGYKFLLPENVLHFTGFTLDGETGISGIRSCSDSVGLGLAAQGYASNLFNNNAQPSGIIECPPGWDDLARNNLAESWQQKHGGVSNSNRVAILEEGAKFVATSFNPEQLQLLSVREFSVTEVARLVGVPPSKLGDMSHEASRSLPEANRDHYETNLLPYLVGIEDEIALKLFTLDERGIYFVKHDMSSLMRADDLTRAQTNDIRMRNGVLTANEWRAEDGKNPYTNDFKITPLNMNVTEDTEVETEPEDDDPVALPAPQDSQEPAPTVTSAARSLAREAVEKIVRREAKNIRRHCGNGIDPDWLDSYYQKELPVWSEALVPALSLYGLATGQPQEVNQVVQYAVERSHKAVQETTDLEGLLVEWQNNKANDILSILEDNHNG